MSTKSCNSLTLIIASAIALFCSCDAAGAAGLPLNEITQRVEPDHTQSPGVMLRLARAAWIPGGARTSSSKIYVFTDTQCPYCHTLWQQIHAANPQVQVRYLLVAKLQPVSWDQAAAILQASDPLVALNQHEMRFSEGGIAPAKQVAVATRENLELNNLFMDTLGIFATPAIVYADEAGVTRILQGLPSAERLQELLSQGR
ncbi:MAG: thiol:disulfide interchange protein DsbG [Steroidobacteraceae bacterium]